MGGPFHTQMFARKQPDSERSLSQRLFGVSAGMIFTVGIVVFCLAAGFLMSRDPGGSRSSSSGEFERRSAPQAARTAVPPPASSLQYSPWGMPEAPAEAPPARPEPPKTPTTAPLREAQIAAEPAEAEVAEPRSRPVMKLSASQADSAAARSAGSYGSNPSGVSKNLGAAGRGTPPAPEAPSRADEQPQYLTNVQHAHGGDDHSHDGIGKSNGAANAHRHAIRQKSSVDRASADATELLGGFNAQKIDLFKLEQIGKRLQDEAARTGKPLEITDERARSIADELGIHTGSKDKKTGTNPF